MSASALRDSGGRHRGRDGHARGQGAGRSACLSGQWGLRSERSSLRLRKSLRLRRSLRLARSLRLRNLGPSPF